MKNNRPVFDLAIPSRKWRLRARVAHVYREHGIKPWRQMLSILRLRFGKGKLEPFQYFFYRLYKPGRTKKEIAGFISVAVGAKLNSHLSPKAVATHNGFLNDKILYALALDRCGIATAENIAFYHPFRQIGTVPSLRSATDIAEFLTGYPHYPIFCKPVDGSRGVGAIKIDGLTKDGKNAVFASGREVPVSHLANEITSSFPEGYIFQEFVKQHPEITKYSPTAVGCVRVVTLMQDDGPEVAYAIWRIPGKGAMADNNSQNEGSTEPQLFAELDLDNGRIISLSSFDMIGSTTHEVHPVTGEDFTKKTIPNWQKLLNAATLGHLMTPDHGILGWDVAIGENGPVIIECNPSPIHVMYQNVTSKPTMDGIIGEKFNRALRRAKSEVKRMETLEIAAVKRNVTAKVNAAMRD